MSELKPEQFEKIGENRKKLLVLEKEGRYVFHGSPNVIGKLEPRQAYNKMEKDGLPAVFATPYADVAIFRALTNFKDVQGSSTSRFGIDGETLHFSATQNLIDHAKRKKGKVYILDKRQFKDFEGMQCRSEETAIPIDVIEVDFNDLPPNVKIIKSKN